MKRFCSCLLALSLTAALLAAPASAREYTDVPAESALAQEVQKAVDYGLMNGYSDSRFGYSDPMTRAQFTAVLVRMMGCRKPFRRVRPMRMWSRRIHGMP